jgi:phage gp29-like protein
MASLFQRVAGAALYRIRETGESFVRAATEQQRRATEVAVRQQQQRGAGDDLGPKPPTEEYQDLPVSVWADWSIKTIRGAIQNLVVGNFGQAALLVEGMLADDRIQAAINGRIKNVTKCAWKFEPAKSGKRQAAELEKLWPQILNEEITEEILMWSTFLGFALCEIIWESEDDLWIPRLKLWHPLFIYYRIDLRKYVAITADKGVIEISEDDPKWFLYAPWGSYRGFIRGAVRSISIPWVVRQYALRDWARFSEVHGLPIKKLMVPAQAPAGDKARFFASVQRLGSESMFSLPQQGDGKGGVGPSFDVQLLEATDQAWKSFPGLIQQCEQSITLAIRGTTLTTSVDGKGSYAASNTHKDEDSDYSIADRRKLAAAANRSIARPFCLFNYGNAKLAPKLSLNSVESDQEKESNVLAKLAQSLPLFENAGWPISRKQSSERFNIPLRDDVDPEKPIEQHAAEQDATMAGLKAAKNVAKTGDDKTDDVGKSGDVDPEDRKSSEAQAPE